MASELDPQNWKGYEGVPPDAKWPGGAKVCVSFVVHAEAGAELHETVGGCLGIGFPVPWHFY